MIGAITLLYLSTLVYADVPSTSFHEQSAAFCKSAKSVGYSYSEFVKENDKYCSYVQCNISTKNKPKKICINTLPDGEECEDDKNKDLKILVKEIEKKSSCGLIGTLEEKIRNCNKEGTSFVLVTRSKDLVILQDKKTGLLWIDRFFEKLDQSCPFGKHV